MDDKEFRSQLLKLVNLAADTVDHEIIVDALERAKAELVYANDEDLLGIRYIKSPKRAKAGTGAKRKAAKRDPSG